MFRLKHLFSSKRPFKLTKAGWVFILYSIGIGAGAINTGNNLIYLMFGIFLGIILASGLLSDLTLWGLEAEWSFPVHGEAGQPSFIRMSVRNTKKRIVSLSVHVEMTGKIRGQSFLLRSYVACVPPLQTAVSSATFVPPRRGWFELETVKFTTKFPFALLIKWWSYRKEQTGEGFFIYPRPLPLNGEELLRLAAEGTQLNAVSEKGEGISIFGIREFRPADNPRRIHWKASAKRPAMENAVSPWMIKEMERDQRPAVVLMWDMNQLVGRLTSEEAERLVQFGASLVEFYESQGQRVEMGLVRGREDVKAVSQVWEFLSLWDPASEIAADANAYLTPASWPASGPAFITKDALALFNLWTKQEKAAR